MPGLHAVLSPSSASRWLSCTPSARLEDKLKGIFGNKSSVFAEEGTLGHALAELKLRKANGELNDFNFNEQRKLLVEQAETKKFNFKELDLITDAYADVVLEKLFTARKTCPDAKLFIEQKLDMARWVPGCFGTGDAVIVSDNTLEICDFKSGAGVPVSAVENPQARLYGLGAVDAFGSLFDFTHVRNTIIQPRLDSVTEETMTLEELLAWGDSIKPKAEIAWKGEGEYVVGSHCRFCAVRAVCAKRASEALSIVKHGFDSPDIIRDEDIPGILEVLDVAESWIKDIRAYALNQAMNGQQFKGWKLVRGRRGRRTFTDPEQVKTILARAGYSEEQYMRNEIKGISDIEKSIGKKAFHALLEEKNLIVQPAGAFVLAPEDDKRPEFTSADADFSDLTE